LPYSREVLHAQLPPGWRVDTALPAPSQGCAALAPVALQMWWLCTSQMLTHRPRCRLLLEDLARFALQRSTSLRRSCCNCVVERRWQPLVSVVHQRRRSGCCTLMRRNSWRTQKHDWQRLVVMGFRLVHVCYC
jgi:hypothetical protein